MTMFGVVSGLLSLSLLKETDLYAICDVIFVMFAHFTEDL